MGNKKVKELKPGQTVPNLRGCIRMEKRVERANLYGQIKVYTKENLKIILLKAKATIFDLIIENIMVVESITKCMVMEFSNGPTTECIKENMTWTRSTDLVYLNGQMANNMKDNGIMVSSMVRDTFTLQEKEVEKAVGRMEREKNGLMNKI